MQIQLYPVIPVAKEKLVDTNGAGDAFVGGKAIPCQLRQCSINGIDQTQVGSQQASRVTISIPPLGIECDVDQPLIVMGTGTECSGELL